MSNALKNAIKRLLEVMIKEGVESVAIRRGWRNAGSTPEDYSVHVNFFRPAKHDGVTELPNPVNDFREGE